MLPRALKLGRDLSLSATYTIKTIGSSDPLLDEVIELWSPERKRLGLFPQGAFEDYARKGGIHVAVNAEDSVVGYIAVRISGGWIHVAHLCVAPTFRRTMIASELVEHVAGIATRYQHLGIRLKCRRDYEATYFWPKVGFHAGSCKAGKGVDSQLILWIRKNQLVDDLFVSRQTDPSRRLAVLDANVFYDLDEHEKNWDTLPAHMQESLYLAADWVNDAIELGIVDEMLTEIHRHTCPLENARQRARAHGFTQVSYTASEVDGNLQKLREILGWSGATREQQRSDMRQIAKAAASDAQFFVTRDRALLDASDAISKAISWGVETPATLLSTLDEEERGHLYVPAKILGTAIRESAPRQQDLDQYAERFLGRSFQEPLHQFRSATRALLASCSGNACNEMKLVSDENKDPILLQCLEAALPDALKLSLFRTSAHPLATTVARHFLLQVIQKAATTGRTKVVLQDTHLSPITEAALVDLGFERLDGIWSRSLCPNVLRASEAERWPDLVARPKIMSADECMVLERRYWPAKIEGSGIESVTITIKPHWAAKLFDSNLAGEELFPVDPARVFNRENVFYRSPRNWPKTSPKRIVWYVSKTNSFRACSRILDVRIEPASALFKRYERLGIYEWRDLMRITKQNRHGEVMAVHFADTEVFDVPVPLSETRNFKDAKILVGAHSISEESFFRIYKSGMARFRSHE